ncbi:C1 family peptidase [Phocaeicola sp.]
MREMLLFTLGLCLFSSCSRNRASVEKHTFTNDTVYACTPVMNQGRTQTCWAYAMASFIESGLLARDGRTVRLSPMYVVRQKYLKQFDEYYYSHGREEIREGSLGHSFITVMREDGLLPLSAYRGARPDAKWHDHRRLIKEIRSLAKKAVSRRNLSYYRKQAIALLDEQMGEVPDTFSYKGITYTPRSFADSLRINTEHYTLLTSFTHHPFYTSFVLEVPDNWEHAAYYNLPLDELENRVREALKNGRTVAWDGDVSEATFYVDKGFAVYPQHPVTQEMRQKEFEQFVTTDDHMMHIVGTAHDENGAFYYLLKNSWGKSGPYNGMLYMSEDYFRAKTVSVLLSGV